MMNHEAVKSFLDSIAYQVSDTPLSAEDAARTIANWKADGIDIPEELDIAKLRFYCDVALCVRYPIDTAPLGKRLDRKVYEYLSDVQYDFWTALSDTISYVNAWHAVESFREDDESNGIPFPSFLTPLVFMRWINSHYAMRKHDKVWIATDTDGEEHWYGPYRSIRFEYWSADEYVTYVASDSITEDFRVTVPERHEIITRDDV